MSKKYEIRTRRIFSEEVRKEVVREVELGKLSVIQASREYCVSTPTIYKWLYKYSRYLNKQSQIVVEKKSENKKRIELTKEKEELERVVGQKQLRIDYLEKMIEMASKELDIDIKKNFGSR